MHLFVPSLGRTARDEIMRGPLPRIPAMYRDRTYIVVPFGQGEAYRAALHALDLSWVRIEETPHNLKGIGPTRHWIGKFAKACAADKFVMMDDDIDFLVRRGLDDWRLRAQTEDDTIEMFAHMEALLNDHASVGISSREGNNRAGVGGPRDSSMVAVATRVMRMFGCRTADWLEMEHGRVEVMEDFDLQLQLLRAGRSNCCMFYYANGQKQTNLPGGCSTYRTHEVQDVSARQLKALHPEFVSLRKKENKTDKDGLGTRTEVTIQWKRAAGLR